MPQSENDPPRPGEPEFPGPPARPRRSSSGRVVTVMLLVLVGYVVLQSPVVKDGLYRLLGRPAPKDAVAWRTDLDSALAEAKKAGKPLLVDFTASWCPPCQVMKREVWPDAEVGRVASEAYVPVLIDIDATANRAAVHRYGITAVPTVMVLDGDGAVLRQSHFMSRDAMLEFLKAGTKAVGS